MASQHVPPEREEDLPKRGAMHIKTPCWLISYVHSMITNEGVLRLQFPQALRDCLSSRKAGGLAVESILSALEVPSCDDTTRPVKMCWCETGTLRVLKLGCGTAS
ncbi:hypothetical protein MN608_09647 [Microdochium nivale]|nr:hypothetical protein MN608_09647 [Microdochium nivale]